MNSKVKNTLTLFVIYAILIIFTLFALFPVLQVINISLRPGNRLLSTDLSIIPKHATLASYKTLLTKTQFLIWLRNSTLISLVVTIFGIFLASLAGYAFSRYRFRGKTIGLMGILATQMFPATMLLLPMFVMLAKLHLINSFLGLFIVYSTTALPFCIWTMKGYYDTIPKSLEEAAFVDGASRFRTFYQIIFPLALPALAITGLFSFMSAWNEYIVAAQILTTNDKFTLPLGLKLFQSNMSTQWGLYAAGSILVSLPVIIVFFAANKYLISGLTLGSVKE